jgi:NADPH2:quinone reductase
MQVLAMKAIQVTKNGGPEVLTYADVPTPQPGPSEALVKLDATGVNFIDIYFRTGLYKADPPFIPGQEGAGVVEEVGAQVTSVKPGDRVAYTGIRGTYAQYHAVASDKLVKVPDGVDTKLAAALMLQGMTVHYLTHSTYALKPGDTCLIHAAAGGVGLLFVQIAKMLGATVIGTCSTEEKAANVRAAGADHVILYSKEDFVARVKEITGGKGVEAAYDGVGQTTWEGSLNCLKPRGMLVCFGNASGPVPPIDPLRLSAGGSLFLTRPTLVHYTATPAELKWRATDILNWVRDGKLDVRIGQEYALADAAQAQTDLAGRKTSGKLVLIP